MVIAVLLGGVSSVDEGDVTGSLRLRAGWKARAGSPKGGFPCSGRRVAILTPAVASLSVGRRTVERVRPTTDLERRVAPFRVVSDFVPSGDQPQAIDELERRIRAGQNDVVLLGATGTGKSATTAWLVERLQRPTLVMAPNKTLAAQLANEFRELLPHNAVEYFVSYYDYYQPEAYVPQTDTYIEKDSSINDEVERLRHSATNSLLTRRDVIVVASVSCIYGLGTPQEYVDRMVRLRVGMDVERDELLRRFVEIQYTRNDLSFTRGTFRVRGDTIEIFPVYEELAVRIEMFGDEIERLMTLHPVTGEVVTEDKQLYVFPATHYVAGPERMERAIQGIEIELADQLAILERQGKLLEAQRLRMRTSYDVEMMRQVGFCSGIENYSRHIDGRAAGSAPNCLLDYFPEDFLLVIDESHVTVPQIGGMYEGDMSRKRTLVEHGFRLPSAMDNRPLRWEEFVDRIGQTVYLSATPGPYELGRTKKRGVVEQIIRPTGLVDPEIVVKPTKGQIDDLVHEIRQRAERDQRVLVTTLTKKMAEDLTDYLLELGVRVRYLHSEVDTLRRVELLRELRLGEFDVLVGINLLREGLDLPEVSLVSILDADKEGFLRSGTSLIQTIGRAARNVSGQVHMYADQVTPSMQHAIDETNRRRKKQVDYNAANGIDPQPLRKRIADITDMLAREDADTSQLLGGSGRQQSRGKAPVPGLSSRGGLRSDAGRHAQALAGMPAVDLADLIQQLTDQMHTAAGELQFELAARLRDEIAELKKELRGMRAAGVS
jgi:excinuclease ABC subunit B